MFSSLWKHLRGISAIRTQRERLREISTVWMCIWQASRTQSQLHFPTAKTRWDTANFQHKNILKTQSLKPNKPCSCKQPMQGTKSLQYAIQRNSGHYCNQKDHSYDCATIWREYCSANYRGHWIPIFHKLVWFLRITMKCQLHTSVKIPQCLYTTTFLPSQKQLEVCGRGTALVLVCFWFHSRSMAVTTVNGWANDFALKQISLTLQFSPAEVG